jgi:hypothetical protein
VNSFANIAFRFAEPEQVSLILFPLSFTNFASRLSWKLILSFARSRKETPGLQPQPNRNLQDTKTSLLHRVQPSTGALVTRTVPTKAGYRLGKQRPPIVSE